jgi:hypothetical protein
MRLRTIACVISVPRIVVRASAIMSLSIPCGELLGMGLRLGLGLPVVRHSENC